MLEDVKTIKALVRNVLVNSSAFCWTIQGFGVLRLSWESPEGDYRLNVWDSRYHTPDVSLMHTHPWHFESLILSGGLCNLRFRSVPGGPGESFDFATIKPGPGGGLLEDEKSGTVHLICSEREYYSAGQSYRQAADEIHVSLPEDGTVTLNLRERTKDDIAQVFWRTGKRWVTAEPRKAENYEVQDIVSGALRIF
jgi:hypothetical protein